MYWQQVNIQCESICIHQPLIKYPVTFVGSMCLLRYLNYHVVVLSLWHVRLHSSAISPPCDVELVPESNDRWYHD